MSTLQTASRRTPTIRHGSGTLLGLLSGLIAVAATAVVLTTVGTTRTRPVTGSRPAATYALIQYRGTGAPPTATPTQRPPAAKSVTSFIRTEHSYGAVP